MDLKVNWTLLPVKWHFFIFEGALGIVLPFRTVFAKQLGISATAIGVIFLIVPFVKIVTNPLIGYVIDYFKRFRLILCVMLVAVALTNIAIFNIPQIEKPKTDFQARMGYRCSLIGNDFQPSFQVLSELRTSEIRDVTSCELVCFSKIEHHDSCAKGFSVRTRVTTNVDKCSDSPIESISFVRIHESDEAPVPLYEVSPDTVTLSDTSDDENVPNIRIPDSSSSPGVGIGPVWKSSLYFETRREFWESSVSSNGTSAFFEIDDVRSLPCACDHEYSCLLRNCEYGNGTGILSGNASRSEACDGEAVETSGSVGNEFLSLQFWSLFVLMGIASVSFSAIIFLCDAVCYEMLAQNRGRFGIQRVWATVGWGLGVPLGGFLNRVHGTEVDYTLSFYVAALLILIDLVPVSRFKVTDVPYSNKIWKDMGRILSRPDVAGNVLVAFIVGILSGCIWNYQFLFMQEIGATHVVMGLSTAVECIGEVPCFLFSGWIIQKIGYRHCYDVTFLCFVLRYICFAYMKDPWMALPVGLLHGPTFGLFYAAMTMYGKSKALPGTEASVQALLNMSFEGIGAGFGSAIGGLAFDLLGSRKTFVCCSIVSFVCLLLHLPPTLVEKLRKRKAARDSREMSDM